MQHNYKLINEFINNIKKSKISINIKYNTIQQLIVNISSIKYKIAK